jgi:ArsR family transcriptional regulator
MWPEAMTDRCVDFCKALCDGTRQRILEMLREREMYVSEIAEAFNLSQPSISHHLGILRQAQVVRSRKEGKQVFYSLNRENIQECCGMLMTRFIVDTHCSSDQEP